MMLQQLCCFRVLRAWFVLLVPGLLLFTGSRTSQAVLVVTPSTTSGNELAYPASATDLINAGQPSLGTVTHTGYSNFSTFSINGLNDGQLGTASTATPEATFDLDGTWTSQFNLNTLLPNTLGYTITEIRTIVGWISDRAGQEYFLDYSVVGNPGFITLDADPIAPGINTFKLFTNISGSSQISITDTTGVVLTGVDAIQFRFFDPATGTASVYREIDVFGFEDSVLPAPEPSSLMLLGLGCVGVMVRRKRQRN